MKRYLFNLVIAFLAFSTGVGFTILIFSSKHTVPVTLKIDSAPLSPTLPERPPDPSDSMIVLERTRCYGTCPVYRLTVFGDGTTIFEGQEFVKTKGVRTGKISEDKLKELWLEADEIEFFNIPDGFPLLQSDYPVYWTDMPSAKIKIFLDDKFKYVSHYQGWQGTKRLEQLTHFEDHIDEAANTMQWIGKRR